MKNALAIAKPKDELNVNDIIARVKYMQKQKKKDNEPDEVL